MKASIFTPEEDKIIVGSEFTLKEIAEKCNKTVSQIKNRVNGKPSVPGEKLSRPFWTALKQT